MKPEEVRNKITDKTKAIMAVHIYGLPVEMDRITELAKEFKLKIIEDAAELIGQEFRGKQCGSFGDVSTFSFYPNKHITTGEGGMIVTDDEEIAERCRSLRNLCFKAGKRFEHDELGFNFRMTNLQAAVGVAQLERLNIFIKKKRHTGKMYNELLKDIDELQLPLAVTDYAENIYWVYGLVLKNNRFGNAEHIMKLLNERGIGTRPFFYPMHMQPVFRKKQMFTNESYPVSEYISEMGFYLPSGLGITDEQIVTTTDELKKIFI
jgi:perosamine synthetase